MSRSALLDLLPDLSRGRPRSHPAREPGFEPLVLEAGSQEEFTSLGMSAGFTGIGAGAAPEMDTFTDPSDLLSGFADTSEPGLLDLPDISHDMDDLPAGLSAEEPKDIIGEPAMDPGDVTSLQIDEIAPPTDNEGATGDGIGIAARELLEASHRADIAELEAAHRKEMEQFVTTVIPRIRDEVSAAIAAELAPLLVERIRADLMDKTLQALTAEIKGLLEDSNAVRFELRGPENLLSAFMEKWTGDAEAVKLVPGDAKDIVAHVDRTVIATRLSEVDRLIGEAMG